MQSVTNCKSVNVVEGMMFLEPGENVNLRFLSFGQFGMSLRENDQVLLMFSSLRAKRNVKVDDVPEVCDAQCFPKDICKFPLESEIEFGER